MTASERAQQINAESRAYMAANPGVWIGELAEDVEHWAEYGIFTADQLDAYLDRCVEEATTDADRYFFENDDDNALEEEF